MKQLIAALATLLFIGSRVAHAQSEPAAQEVQARVGASLSKKLIRKVYLFVDPEMRTDGLNPDRYLIEGGLRYKPIKYFSARGAFRADMEETNDGLEHGYRPRFALSGHLPLDDFEGEARVQYTHAFGPDRNLRRTLRYRLGVAWNVPKIRLELNAAAEAFHALENHNIRKMRYSFGGQYKFYKSKKFDQWFGLEYMLDYYLDRPLNVHIPVAAYKARWD